MDRFDASLLARIRYAAIATDALQTDFVVIARGVDGTPTRGFVETGRAVPLQDGFGAAFWEDGSVRHFGFYDAGKCVSSIDLHAPSEQGLFRQGRAMRTGELYNRGTVETLSPWSDNAAAASTEQSYEAWVIEHVAAVRAHQR